LANGNSISNILTQSEDCFRRNHGLYTEVTLLSSVGKQGIPQTYKQKTIENPELAKEFMLKAHEAGFPSATFDLLKEAIKAKK